MARAFGDDPSLFDNDAVIGHREHHRHVLLDDNNRHLFVSIDPDENVGNLVHEDWHDPIRRFIEQHQPRMGHQPAADRQHLLLAAAERAGRLA